MDDTNDVIVKAWNTVLFDKFRRFKHLLIDGLAAHSNEALARARYPKARACSTSAAASATARGSIATHVGASGAAVGVDCAPRFVEAAQQPTRAPAASPTPEFFVADVQADDLRGPYDRGILALRDDVLRPLPAPRCATSSSRSPPAGELFMIVWRRREDNPWLHDAELCVPRPGAGGEARGHGPGALRPRPLLDVGRPTW